MENKLNFHKIGRFSSTTSVNIDPVVDFSCLSNDPTSAIEMNNKADFHHQEIDKNKDQVFFDEKKIFEKSSSLQKTKKNKKKQKISKESLGRYSESIIQKQKLDKLEWQQIIKMQEMIKLFYQKVTLNSVLRKPIYYNPLENTQLITQCSFPNINFSLNKKITYIFYTLKILFLVVFLFILPLSLLYSHLSNSQFLVCLKIGATFLSFVDIFETITKKYAGESNFGFHCNKYSQFNKQKRFQIACDLIFFISSLCSLVLQNNLGNIALIGACFNLNHFTTQIRWLEDEFLSATYTHKYWDLCKIIIKNLFVCHLLACTLIAISFMNIDDNWMISTSIDKLQWWQQYIWSYYFGITIILTIGFGDLHANNTSEALLIIVISFFSCVFFGYNINYIGNLINSIKQEQNQKNKKLKLLSSLSKKSKVSKAVCDDISRYIIEESKIKQQSNYQQERILLKELPSSLRSSFLQEANQKLFNHLKNLIPLSCKTVQQLSLKIQARLCHPDELIKGSHSLSSLIILQSGEVGYTARAKYPSKLRHVIIQRISTKIQKQSKLICLDILTQPLNYDIKALDYSIIYEMNKQNFQSSLLSSQKDYQIYRQLLDKCKFKINEFALTFCRFCENRLHTLFQCPKLHYQPFRHTLPLKSIKSNGVSKQQRVKINRKKKQLQCQIIFESRTFPDLDQSQLSNEKSNTPQITIQITNESMKYCRDRQRQKFRSKCFKPSSDNMLMTMQMINQIRNDIKNLKRASFQSFEFTLWSNIDCDQPCNFSYYFNKWNPDSIGSKQIKNTLMGKTTRIKRKPKY